MTSSRNKIIEFIEQGIISEEKIGEALIVAKVTPNGKSWQTFIDHLLLWLGGGALAFSAMFFIAYNWDDIGRYAKFGIVEGFIILAIITYCKLGENTAASKVSLLIATICLGVLLALYGQTYQTGADPWQLFFNWSILMLPWAIIGRFPAIWIIWVILINVSIVLYHQTFQRTFWFMFAPETVMLWLTFFFNSFVLAVWEFLAKTWDWLSKHWAIRLVATGSGVSISWLVLHSIFAGDESPLIPSLSWVIWLVVMYFIYRKIRPDLFMLASCCLSGITVTISFLGKHILDSASSVGFLVLALLVISMGSGAAFWLKNIHEEIDS